MDLKETISIKQFGPGQSEILFKTYVFQKICPGKFLIEDPWPHDELSEEETEELKSALRDLMPLDTMVTDMWDWDLHFEDSTLEDCYFDVALGSEEFALEQAGALKDEILDWIDKFAMDYAENEFEEGEFEKWILDQCTDFILRWRDNIVRHFTTTTGGNMSEKISTPQTTTKSTREMSTRELNELLLKGLRAGIPPSPEKPIPRHSSRSQETIPENESPLNQLAKKFLLELDKKNQVDLDPRYLYSLQLALWALESGEAKVVDGRPLKVKLEVLLYQWKPKEAQEYLLESPEEDGSLEPALLEAVKNCSDPVDAAAEILETLNQVFQEKAPLYR